MGFLSKLLGKKDETDFIKMMVENKRKLDASANYQVSCSALRAVFYESDFSAEMFFNNVEYAKKLVTNAVIICSRKGVTIPANYYSLPVTFVSNCDKTKYGYIVEFGSARYECECNFIAMMFVNGKKIYYTNEFFESDKSYSLCSFDAAGNRRSGISHPKTYEDFKKAVIG